MTAIYNPATPVDHRRAHVVVPNHLRLVIAEARPVVQVVFLLRLLAATGLFSRVTRSDFAALAGWLLLVVAVYVFNGISDLASDSANGSQRPIASGRLSAEEALHWCLGAAAAGLALCWVTGSDVFGLGVLMLALGWSYSEGPAFKRAPAGFAVIVGAGAGLTYVVGWFASGATGTDLLGVMLAVSAWVGLCCASKDFSDVDGDRLAGRRTWPVVLGPKRAAALLGALAIASSSGILLASIAAGVTVVPGAILLAGSVLIAATSLTSAGYSDRALRRRPYRAFMATQYATNCALILIGLI